MYGLVFYLKKEILMREYDQGESDYKQAYEDIRDILRHYGFHWLSNSFYFSRSINNLLQITKALQHIKSISWFKKALVSLHVFKMEDLSNFTEYIIGEE
ncbi:virulence protein [Metamycoplasma phocicerebrale]|uniref:Virulence protein n=1 Tax=Metamycoplasma phocicerebrale TaxID=142649 RepID=A0A3T0TTH4_9BACT|nr:virulence protein [Metamycoplasma phocicerebrale]AZZ65344.1 virulence protein [Metamycoplasma phocicerebrale]